MNRVLLGLNILLVAAVGYLFYKTSSGSATEKETKEEVSEVKEKQKPLLPEAKKMPVTGKIAFVNMDSLSNNCQFVIDMIKRLKGLKNTYEANLENMGMQYQEKMKEYQAKANAGIAPESEMNAKVKEIQSLERDIQNKQIQMDNLGVELNEKSYEFNVELKKILSEKYADKYDYVISYSDAIPSLLYGNATLDITQEVIDQMNANYKENKSKSKKK